MSRVYNYSAGPAALPLSVLERAQAEFLDYAGSGMSLLEMSHRSATYQQVIDGAEAKLRALLGLDDAWDVLFLQGGATLEFAAIPMNLMRKGRAGYVVSGHFAEVAQKEAAKYGESRILASSKSCGFAAIPDLSRVPEAASELDYVYICQNNTIFGTMFTELPKTGNTPLVADVSSCFLSYPLDVERYGLIFAGAQKNAGPAGVTVVCVRKDLVSQGPALEICPSYLDFKLQAQKGSMLNTPNTFGIYLAGMVFDWVTEQGGLAAMQAFNQQKAALLYDCLDQSKLFSGTAEPASRSICNVCFTTGSAELDAQFVCEATAAGLTGLKGHRVVGGMRASIYNAVTLEAVHALVAFMHAFEAAHRSDAQ